MKPGWRDLDWLRSDGSRFSAFAEVQFFVMGMLELLLAVGSIAMLRWQEWGRKMVVIWAVLAIAARMALDFLTTALVLGLRTSHPESFRHASIRWEMFNTIIALFQSFALPLIYLGVLRTAEVKSLFAHSDAGGFGVIPTAPDE
jgi:hypothetical protein